MQKEKLQIVSIFRFGHKKRGLFQCPPKGKEFLLAVFKAVRERSFLLVEMVRMGLIVVLPLLVRVRREANTSSGNSVGVAKAESPSPTTLKPLPNPPQREGVPSNRLKHSKNGLPPLGEGQGGASPKQLFFYRRQPDFFYRRRRLFLPWSLLASCTA